MELFHKGNILQLLKFPHSTDEIITERIHGLNKLIAESGDDAHVNAIIEMLISYISVNYEGVYIDQTLSRLIEAHAWWSECYDPNATLSVMQDIEE